MLGWNFEEQAKIEFACWEKIAHVEDEHSKSLTSYGALEYMDSIEIGFRRRIWNDMGNRFTLW